jgi:hypothetical protein
MFTITCSAAWRGRKKRKKKKEVCEGRDSYPEQ